MGVLMASGLIVGESLFGVFNAGVIGATENEAPFAVFNLGEAWPDMLIGLAAFVVITAVMYRWVRGRAAKV
jgi:hypothetical protein